MYLFVRSRATNEEILHVIKLVKYVSILSYNLAKLLN